VRSAGEEEPADNPFRTFDEWYSDADADAYADLTELVPNRGGSRVPSFLATDVDVRTQAGIRKRPTFSRAALGTSDERISTLLGPSS
jgi:hypothetical protein